MKASRSKATAKHQETWIHKGNRAEDEPHIREQSGQIRRQSASLGVDAMIGVCQAVGSRQKHARRALRQRLNGDCEAHSSAKAALFCLASVE